MGFFFGLILQEALLYLIPFRYSIYIAFGVFGILFIILNLMFKEQAYNPSLAFIGSFLIARGIGLFLDYDYEFSLYY